MEDKKYKVDKFSGGKSGIAETGQFYRRVPSLEVLQKPRAPVPGRERHLSHKPQPESKLAMIRQLKQERQHYETMQNDDPALLSIGPMGQGSGPRISPPRSTPSTPGTPGTPGKSIPLSSLFNFDENNNAEAMSSASASTPSSTSLSNFFNSSLNLSSNDYQDAEPSSDNGPIMSLRDLLNIEDNEPPSVSESASELAPSVAALLSSPASSRMTQPPPMETQLPLYENTFRGGSDPANRMDENGINWTPVPKGTFPVFTSMGRFPGEPNFNPVQSDFDDKLPPYVVKIESEIPLDYIDTAQYENFSASILPIFVFEQPGAYIIHEEDNEYFERCPMYILPAGHYGVNQYDYDYNSIHLCWQLIKFYNNIDLGNGVKWFALTITQGYFMSKGKIYRLPEGTFISKTRPRRMMPMAKYMHNCIKNITYHDDILSCFQEHLFQSGTSLQVQMNPDWPESKQLSEAMQDPHFLRIMQFHAQNLIQFSAYDLMKLFFGKFKRRGCCNTLGKPRGKLQTMDAMEVFMYMVQMEVLEYYYGPAPPFSVLEECVKSPRKIASRVLAKKLMKNQSGGKKKKSAKNPVEEAGPPGKHRSRLPSNLALNSGLDPKSVAIDSHGSSRKVIGKYGKKKTGGFGSGQKARSGGRGIMSNPSLGLATRARMESTSSTDSWATVADSEDEDVFDDAGDQGIDDKDLEGFDWEGWLNESSKAPLARHEEPDSDDDSDPDEDRDEMVKTLREWHYRENSSN